jgi:hypothetical protein
VIVKNRQGTPDAPIPPGTLSQAGSLSVATSKAWESKALLPAWWVQAHQVSKTNERGELLASGGFVIKGEKNYLAPSPLVLGFAVMFQISKESVPNHRKHRLADVEETATAVDETPKDETRHMSSQQETDATTEGKPDADVDVERTPDGNGQGVDEEEEEESSDSDSDKDDEDEGAFKSNPLQTSTPRKEVDRVEDSQVRDGESSDEDEQEGEQATQNNNETTLDYGTSVAETVDSSTSQRAQGKRYLLAREKKLLEKNRSDTPDETPLSTPADTPSRSTTPSQPATKQNNPSAAAIRGKKGKVKKAAQKYAEQDEEDRELALRLLGSTAKANKAAEAAAAKAKREAELEAQKQRRRAQHDRVAESERKRHTQLEDGDEDNSEETARAEAEDLSWLPALIGTPLPEDEVLAAIPVSAPWAALSRYKYRAKLQPGSIKKGKAVKEILGHWMAEAGGSIAGPSGGGAGATTFKKAISEDIANGLDRATAERMRSREADLLKTWRDVEVVNTVPVSRVRIVSGGAGGGGKGSGGGKGGGGGGGGKADSGKGKAKGKGGGGGKKK